MGNEDEQVNFHGFGDGDSVKCAVEAKVAKVREFQIQRQLPPSGAASSSSSTSGDSSAIPSRGLRFFLKTNVKGNKPVSSGTTNLFAPKPALHPAASPATPLGGYRRAQQNKFLKMKTSSCPTPSTTTTTTTPTPAVDSAGPSPKVRLVVEEEKETKPDPPVAPSVHPLPPKLFQQNGLSSSSEEEDKEMPSLKKNGGDPLPPPSQQEQQPLVSSKKSNKKVVESVAPPTEDPPPQKVTPAKRTISSKSTSELSFLPGQSSRSKRTIVPNKRFFSVDSPPAPAVAEPPSSSPSKPSRKSTESNTKKRAMSVGGGGASEVAPSSTATVTNRKRKLSSGTSGAAARVNGGEELVSPLQKPVKVPVNVKPATISPSPPAGVESSTNGGGRPRRTIIPNRKFRDEDVASTAPPPTTFPSQLPSGAAAAGSVPLKNISPPICEPSKQKRRISAPKPKQQQQQQQNGIAPFSSSSSPPAKKDPPFAPLAPQLVFPLGGKLNGNLEQGGASAERAEGISECALVAVMEVSLEEMPTTAAAVEAATPLPPVEASIQLDADDKSSIKSPPASKVPDENQDELAMEESERKMYKGKPIFLGTCIVKAVDQNGGDAQKVNEGIIYCGICSRVKKYRVIPEKRRRGSFLCSDCTQIVSKIFQTAMKARPFECILGPPVCEGSCPLELSPPGLFCQACFAKTCLRNLPMKDDIYFKIWRSIPPMSRGCVPTTPPSSNPNSPYVGKVVYVKLAGGGGDEALGLEAEIVSSTGSLKMFGGAGTGGGAGTLKKKGAGAASSLGALTGTEDDSNSTYELTNGDDDLNSARITTFSNHCAIAGGAAGTNRENAMPASSSSLNLTDHQLIKSSTNGVLLQSHEELICCSFCCEPYHPYCAGDDLLLDTYIARCGGGGGTTEGFKKGGGVNLRWTCRRCLPCHKCGECIGPAKEMIRCNRCRNAYHLEGCVDKQEGMRIREREELERIWCCADCLSCKSCGKRIMERKERLRTMDEVAKGIEQGVGGGGEEEEGEKEELELINRLMLCLECFKQRKKGSYCPICEICYDDNDWDSKMMECCKCNRWIHATCENLDDDQYQILGQLPEYIEYICKLCHEEASPSTKPLWYEAIGSLLNKECNSVVRLFEQKCLGTATLMRRRSSSIDLVKNKKPSFVCNLFGRDLVADENGVKGVTLIDLTQVDEEEENGTLADESSLCRSGRSTPTTIVSSFEGDSEEDEEIEDCVSYTPPRPQLEEARIARRRASKMTSRQLLDCKVMLRDFVEHPASLEENLWALKVMGVEVLNEKRGEEAEAGKDEVTPVKKLQTTPILDRTPQRKMMDTPSKVVTGIMSALKKRAGGGGWRSLRGFWREFMGAVEKLGGGQKETIVEKAKEAFEKSFPWFISSGLSCSPSPEKKEEDEEEEGELGEVGAREVEENPFREVYWDSGDFFDERPCVLCGEVGDFPPESCGRLLWCGLNEWIHCNCAIWSSEVWELESGALQQVGGALNRGRSLKCKICGGKGATVSCCHSSCKNSYHFKCALEGNCWLLANKTMFCEHHKLSGKQMEGIQEKADMKVARKVYVDLEWIQKRGLKAHSGEIMLCIGSMKVASFGEILPISANEEGQGRGELVPCGFRSQRIFWEGGPSEPWAKTIYCFGTEVDSNGFDESLKTLDAGVNIRVKHCGGNGERGGLESVKKFHMWVQEATRYVDENKVEWLIPCPLKIEEEEEEDDEDVESGIDVFNNNKGRSSPSSVSSFGSFVGGGRRGKGVKRKKMCGGTTDTDGYASSVDSFNETPRSSKPSKQVKRRRRSSPKKAARGTAAGSSCESKLESPRRRSLRNLRQLPPPDDSDNDSGVTDTSGGGPITRCRLNLLTRFNESFKGEEGVEVGLPTGIMECPKLSPSPDKRVVEVEVAEERNKIYTASIRFQLMQGEGRQEAISLWKNTADCWNSVFEKICKARHENGLGKLVHPTLNVCYENEDLFEAANSLRMVGLSHPNVQYIAEQLPGILNVVASHEFEYSRKPYVGSEEGGGDMRGAGVGSSRCEIFQSKKPFDMFGWLAHGQRKVAQLQLNSTFEPEGVARVQGLPLAMQFRDLKEKAKRKFVVLHSEIHGRGLFSRCDVEKGEMLIEYAGEVIRSVLSDPRERYYESKGIGCYMFRCKGQVIDATMKGNAARFINHSCEPNCEAKTVRILGKDHIIIFALRKIWKGEELTYDYKFEREENKIPCSCGASRCRKYMN